MVGLDLSEALERRRVDLRRVGSAVVEGGLRSHALSLKVGQGLGGGAGIGGLGGRGTVVASRLDGRSGDLGLRALGLAAPVSLAATTTLVAIVGTASAVAALVLAVAAGVAVTAAAAAASAAAAAAASSGAAPLGAGEVAAGSAVVNTTRACRGCTGLARCG